MNNKQRHTNNATANNTRGRSDPGNVTRSRINNGSKEKVAAERKARSNVSTRTAPVSREFARTRTDAYKKIQVKRSSQVIRKPSIANKPVSRSSVTRSRSNQVSRNDAAVKKARTNSRPAATITRSRSNQGSRNATSVHKTRTNSRSGATVAPRSQSNRQKSSVSKSTGRRK